MICVSVAEKELSASLRAIKGRNLAEIRLDAAAYGLDGIRKIFSQPCLLVATCRPGKYTEKERLQRLICAIESGAAFVDIELEAKAAYRKTLIKCARLHGCVVIVSFHDFEGTPSQQRLLGIVNRCFDAGADAAKIACQVNSAAEAARLLGLLENERLNRNKRLLVVGMGEQGRLVRVVAPLLGSIFTFAAAAKGKATAAGQLSVKEMERLYASLGQMSC